jgi:hypothetical protein
MSKKTAHQDWKALPERYREPTQAGLEQWTSPKEAAGASPQTPFFHPAGLPKQAASSNGIFDGSTPCLLLSNIYSHGLVCAREPSHSRKEASPSHSHIIQCGTAKTDEATEVQ